MYSARRLTLSTIIFSEIFLLKDGIIGLFSCSEKREKTAPIRKELVEAVSASVAIARALINNPSIIVGDGKIIS